MYKFRLDGKTVCKNCNRVFKRKDISLAKYHKKYPAIKIWII